MVDFGYSGSYIPIKTTCNNKGQLHFRELKANWVHKRPGVSDKSKSLSAEELKELDFFLRKFLAVKEITESNVYDGGSFELSVKREGQNLHKLHCYHSFEDRELDQAMAKLRKLLKEDFFLKKYDEQISR